MLLFVYKYTCIVCNIDIITYLWKDTDSDDMGVCREGTQTRREILLCIPLCYEWNFVNALLLKK